MSHSHYTALVLRNLWAWADEHHRGELDGGRRQGRPPVLENRFASKGILVPPNRSKALRIRAAIPDRQRHRWYCSLKSSQALGQSVFGAVGTFDRLDLLQDLRADCSRPAFIEDSRELALKFEHELNWLGEPTPTSIDVLLHGPESRVAIECKFTEQEFGICSRPRLRPGEASYDEQYCDGNYRVQRSRCERCALTEIGVRYWQYLPQLFGWAADRDHVPCPFGDAYQLARNALAAAFTPDGALDSASGHVLVVYDARNPQFQENGKAENQWRSATAECRIPGLFRRLSWQRLITTLTRAPELAYLVDAAESKYGLTPE